MQPAPTVLPWCFATRARPAMEPVETRLPTVAAEALAALIPVLGCGEEAAGLAFEGLSREARDDAAASAALNRIGQEEQAHEALLRALAVGLPEPAEAPRLMRAAQRFHLDLGRDSATARLARIAALDSAVCLILARLLRPGAPLSSDPVTHRLLRSIARDEARHVRTTRTLAMARADRGTLNDWAAPVRPRLAALLNEAGEALELLGLDPDWLTRAIAPLPNGLFRA